MAENTKIEWTEATWNPVTGCSKVSAGCKNCYAERDWQRLSANPKTRYFGRKFTDVQCHDDVLDRPLRWRNPRKIFVNSMSDLFHPDVPDYFIDQVFGVMWACLWLHNERPGHIFQVLTKRADRMHDYLSKDRRQIWADSAVNYGGGYDPDGIWDQTASSSGVHPRIWLGVSVEDQQTADERIPLLLKTPAAVRWVSMEPLIGAVDLFNVAVPKECDLLRRPYDICGSKFNALQHDDDHYHQAPATLDWVVVGGESGHNARPMHPDWAESLQQQCESADVPFFMKQLSGPKGRPIKDISSFPASLQVREYPRV